MKRPRRKMDGSARSKLLVLLGVVALSALACTTPEQKLWWKVTFFDGVPPPGHEAQAEGFGEEEQQMTPAAKALAALKAAKHEISRHGPYAQKKCSQCHASEYSNKLKAKPPELCYGCHEVESFPGKYRHGPFRAGLCLACHDPHSSPNKKLLLAKREELCLTCHDATTYVRIDEHIAKNGSDCLGCHRPHAGERPKMLRKGVVVQ